MITGKTFKKYIQAKEELFKDLGREPLFEEIVAKSGIEYKTAKFIASELEIEVLKKDIF